MDAPQTTGGTLVLPNPVGVPRLDGIPLTLDGKVYILPPCNLRTLKRYAKAIDDYGKAGNQLHMSGEAVDTIINVVTAALQRNYPDFTGEMLEEHIGVDTMVEVFQMALDVSGLIRKRRKEEAAAQQTAGEGGTLGELTGTALPLTS